MNETLTQPVPPRRANATKKLIAEKVRKNRHALWEWHLHHARLAPPPFYCSIDLRDSGHKIVPVDSNLFPAGLITSVLPTFRQHLPKFARSLKRLPPTMMWQPLLKFSSF